MTPLYARLSGALLLVLLLAVPARAADTPPVDVVDGAVVWSPEGVYAQAAMTLSSPSGLEYRRAFGPGEVIRLHPSELGEAPLPDGFYEYRLLLVDEIPDSDEQVNARSLSGTIEVRDGAAVDSPLLDIVHNDDVIILGSLCVGFDCVNNMNFGFDTIVLQENNLRIHFNDTSTSASFPDNDWEITINDSTNGGNEFFAVTDRSAGRRVMELRAGAPANSLFVSSAGRLGLKTANPVVELHIADGDTPTVRLEQNGTSGFTPQTWDLAGNETNFFIRDVTNGSRLPFRIRPGAQTSSLDIQASGKVNIGTSSVNPSTGSTPFPSGEARLVIFDVDGDLNNNDDLSELTDKVALFNSDVEVMGTIDVKNRVNVDGPFRVQGKALLRGRLEIDGTYTSGTSINLLNAGVSQLEFTSGGDMNITGTFGTISDVNRKDNIVPADTDAILDGLATLPISHWQYIDDADDATHLGPMAQDFADTFGLGKDETRITTIDFDGVALASIQALYHRNEAAATRIAELEAANAALEARLARLEALLGADHE